MFNRFEEFKSYYPVHTRTETADYFGISKTAVDKLSRKLGIPRKTFQYRDLAGLTQIQRNIILGSLLGDGCLSSVGRHGRKNSCFAEVHSEKQYGLLEWKMKNLMPFSKPINSKTVVGRKNEDGKVVSDHTKSLRSCALQTVVHPELTQLELEWYKRDSEGCYVLSNGRRIKTVPMGLALTADIIAVWYFDDGSNNAPNRQATFNTQAFSKEDVEMLVSKLTQFGINCGPAKNRDSHVIITRASSYLDLIELARERLPCECMFYKTDLSKYIKPNFSTRFNKKSPGKCRGI